MSGIDRRTLLSALGLSAVGAGGVACLEASASESGSVVPKVPVYEQIRNTQELRRLQPRALIEVQTAAPVVALTFDDGPDPRYTPTVLDLLDEFEATATFFLIGQNVDYFPGLACEIVERGHSLGNHTYAHPNLVEQSASKALAQIDQASNAIASVTGETPRYFRPPIAATSQAIGVLTDARQLTTVYWSVSLEALLARTSPENAAIEAARRSTMGSIILAHDGGRGTGDRSGANGRHDRSQTIAALPVLLGQLRSQGLQIADISTLLAASSAVPIGE